MGWSGMRTASRCDMWSKRGSNADVAANVVERTYYRHGDCAAHIHRFAAREREKDELQMCRLSCENEPAIGTCRLIAR